MAAGDTYHIKGGMVGEPGALFIGGNSDDGIQIDSFMAARVTANDTSGTFSARFNVADDTGTYAILGGGDASAVQYFYIAVVAGQIQVKAALVGPNVAWDLISTDAVINPHQWHEVTLVHDSVIPKIYLDGKLLTVTETDITEATFWFDAFALIDGGHIGAADSIGGDAALTLEFKGAVGKVKYWNDALTAAEVLDNFNGHGPTGNLIATWDMKDNVLDDVGGENGTIVGQVILSDNHSEFTSKFSFLLTPTVVADIFNFSVENDTGYAIIVKAA
ncbi:MAG: LamG domain-containing protein [Bacteroidetes bacterium]|nr:LamG domain-containing protein [Bacteroidota bacterium]